jgi:hypothetical protein
MNEPNGIVIKTEKDDIVSIHMSRGDLLDLYSGLRGLKYDYSSFAGDEVRELIKRFFSENQDVKTDPDYSFRFSPNLREE